MSSLIRAVASALLLNLALVVPAAAEQVGNAPNGAAQHGNAQTGDAAQAAKAEPAPAADLSRYKEESVPGGTMLLVAYMVMWALVAGFVVRTVLRQAKIEAELTELSEQVEVMSGADP